jgi:hypothetical protein
MRKLNIGAVIRAVIGVVTDIGLVSRAGGLWFGVLVAAELIRLGFTFPALATLMPPANFILRIVQFLALGGCAVNIHRAVLLRESPTPYRVSDLEWRYVLRTAWIGTPVFLALMGGFFILWRGSRLLDSLNFFAPGVLIPVLALTAFVATAFIISASLSLPAAAIGRFEFTMSDGLDTSFGNAMRLFLISFVLLFVPCNTAVLLTFGVMFGLFMIGADFLAQPAYIVLMPAIAITGAMIWAATLSFAYKGLIEGDPEFATETAPSA